MIQRRPPKLYPSGESRDKLANDFSDYFSDKIDNIRANLNMDNANCDIRPRLEEKAAINSVFSEFITVTEEQLIKHL